jgi:outer membrane protein insertion porin family
MNKKIFRLLILCLFLITPTYAELVKNVEINGNTRLSDESILVFTKIDLTKDFTKNDFNRILKDLYETNFFKNIEINIIDQVLVINVVENFIIENLIFNGIKNEKIIEAITEISKLKNRSSFNESILFTDVNNIKNFLKNSGYYFADVKTSLDSNIEKNTTDVIYNINLGSRAKIDEIVFIGDKKFKDRKLANVIVSEEAKIWKFISNKKYLNKERIDLDKRLLKNFYKNKGFFNISIEESFAEFRDNNSFKLTYNINAGKKFFFNNIKLLLPDDYNKDDFSEIYKLANKYKKKEYSLKLIEKILEKVDAIALLKKYEFIDATISENIVDNNKLNFSIIVTESKKYYIEKINIKGNGHTIEEVIRNSLIVDEGDPFNNILFNKSINAIKSKGIFKTVNTKVVEGSSSQLKIVDI